MKIEEREYEIVMEFPVLWDGWEIDNRAWVVRDPKTERLKLVMTNHGSRYIAKPQVLQRRLEAYRKVANETRKALALLEGKE